jgi:uncharacterized protein YkwD
VLEEMEWVKRATATHNADGTTSYTVTSSSFPAVHQASLILGSDTLPLTKAEKKQIRKCNTAKFAFLYMAKQSREFIKLMNLCRNDGPLFYKYIHSKYGKAYSSLKLVEQFLRYKKSEQKPYLRPSILLHFTALFHAIASGISGYEGHRWLDFRLYMFFNLNCLLCPYGENCDYGSRKAIDCIIDLLGSPPHRSNILDAEFTRVGVASFFHTKYGHNQVSTFTGPKLIDEVLYRRNLSRREIH